MKKIVLLSIFVIVLINITLGGGFKINRYFDYHIVDSNNIPAFLIELKEADNIYAYFYEPQVLSVDINDSIIKFYRVILDKRKEKSRFSDYFKDGSLFRSGEIVQIRDTLIIEDRNDSLYSSKVTFNITEYFYGDKNISSNIVKATYQSVVILNKYSTQIPQAFERHGICKQYYSSGFLKEEINYNEGKLSDGLNSFYHPNQKLAYSYKISNNVLQDTVKNYDAKGALIGYSVFNDGLLIYKHSYTDTIISSKNKKALLVAIGDYPEESGCPKINSKNDAYFIKKMLLSKGFAEDNIIELIDSAATLNNIYSAFEKLSASVNAGDVVYIQFSAMSYYLKDKDVIIPYEYVFQSNEFLEKDYQSNKFLKQEYLFQKINEIRNASGLSGQVVLTIDACYKKDNISQQNNEVVEKTSIVEGFRSVITSELISTSNEKSPFVIIYPDGMTYETFDEETKLKVGVISYNLYNTITKLPSFNFENVSYILPALTINSKYPTKTLIEGNLDIPIFESQPWLAAKESTLKPKGNAFVLSIGINEYSYDSQNKMTFTNCSSDAKEYEAFFTAQFKNTQRSEADRKFKIYPHTLINHNATKDSIINAINRIISVAQPDDYFIFNFSGYTASITEPNGKKATWFVPYGLKNILDTAEVKTKGISLNQIKDLFQFIPAKNQLFVTEAGQTEDFKKEFVKSLIESNPTIASISASNRVIIVPESEGRDYFKCKYQKINHGPINYILTSLSPEQNIFQLFESGSLRKEVEYALHQKEMECNISKKAYTQIFFERDFIADLKYYLPDEIMNTRGSNWFSVANDLITNKIGNKHALIIGTDNYKNATGQWGKLSNPAIDAKTIAEELSNSFGYAVRLLIDPPLDTIYKVLIEYSKILDSTDQFILFAAGHGDFDDMLDDGMIVCNDSKLTSDDQARNSYIQYSKLTRMINKLAPKQILVMLDVCFGGTFDERVVRNKNRGDTYSSLGAKDFLQNKLKYTTRLYISSGGKKEVPDGYKGKHSPFAYKILEALRTRGDSYGAITASDIFQFVKKLPSEPLLGSFGDDQPGSEFILISK